jgi:mannosyltransferase OCH1-like enzyme
MQTYRDNYIHPFIYTNIQHVLNTNPNYDYCFITDETIVPLIQNNFESHVLNAFLSIKSGAAKSDFIRYIFLYLYGGIYYDLDVDMNMNLDEFIKPDADFVFFTRIDNNPHQHSIIEQFIIMISKKNSIMKNVIDEMVIRIFSGEENIFLTTGPRMFEDVIYNLIENKKLYNIRKLFTTEQKRNFIEKNRKCSYNAYTGYLFNIDTFDQNYTMIKPKLKGYFDKMLYYDRFKYGEHNLSIYSEIMKEIEYNVVNTENFKLSIINYTDLYKKICLLIYNNSELLVKQKQQDIDKYEMFSNEYNLETEKLLEIKYLIYNIYKKQLFEKYPIKTCDKCHFKSYNETAYFAHAYFCNINKII